MRGILNGELETHIVATRRRPKYQRSPRPRAQRIQ